MTTRDDTLVRNARVQLMNQITEALKKHGDLNHQARLTLVLLYLEDSTTRGWVEVTVCEVATMVNCTSSELLNVISGLVQKKALKSAKRSVTDGHLISITHDRVKVEFP